MFCLVPPMVVRHYANREHTSQLPDKVRPRQKKGHPGIFPSRPFPVDCKRGPKLGTGVLPPCPANAWNLFGA